MTINVLDRRESNDKNVQFILEAMLCGLPIGVALIAADIGYVRWFAEVVMPTLRDGNGPMLSYGSAWAGTAPLIFLLGMALGTTIAAARRWGLLVASSLLGATAVLVAAIVSNFWLDQIHRYGLDPSDGIVFVPPLAMAAVCMVLAAVLAVSSWFSAGE